MLKKLMAWFQPTNAEREEARRLAQQVRDLEHGHLHEHVDGIVHAHEHGHGHGDHDHEHEHEHEHGR